MTIDVLPPASVIRLVIGAWLQRAITVFVIDPEEEHEIPKLTVWSSEEILRFATAKQLAYIGDQRGAVELLQGFVEQEEQVLSFETRQILLRKTEGETFVGSNQIREMPDGRSVQMFRGLRSDLYEQIVRHSELARRPEDSKTSSFSLETVTEGDTEIVRSISRSGSLLEIQIS